MGSRCSRALSYLIAAWLIASNVRTGGGPRDFLSYFEHKIHPSLLPRTASTLCSLMKQLPAPSAFLCINVSKFYTAIFGIKMLLYLQSTTYFRYSSYRMETIAVLMCRWECSQQSHLRLNGRSVSSLFALRFFSTRPLLRILTSFNGTLARCYHWPRTWLLAWR